MSNNRSTPPSVITSDQDLGGNNDCRICGFKASAQDGPVLLFALHPHSVVCGFCVKAIKTATK